MSTQIRRTAFAPFLAYVAVFHVAWIAWPLVVAPRLTALGQTTVAYAVLNIGIRGMIWIAPVLLYLRYVDDVRPLEYLKLTDHVGRGILVAVVLTGGNVIGSLLRFGVPLLSMDRITWNSVFGTSLLIGLIEEIPYRGFMLQKFSERVGFWPANLITSLLFLGIHLPGWLALGTLKADAAATVFIIGAVLAMAFRYSGSLWAPIVIHSANNFFSFVIFRL